MTCVLVLCLGFAQATESQMAKAWKMSEKLQSQRPRRSLEAVILVPPCDILRRPATPCDLRLHLAAFHGQVRHVVHVVRHWALSAETFRVQWISMVDAKRTARPQQCLF